MSVVKELISNAVHITRQMAALSPNGRPTNNALYGFMAAMTAFKIRAATELPGGNLGSKGKDGLTFEQSTILKMIHWEWMWASDGFPIFKLSEDFALGMLATGFHGMTGIPVNYPYNAFLIQLPEQPILIPGIGCPPIRYILHAVFKYPDKPFNDGKEMIAQNFREALVYYAKQLQWAEDHPKLVTWVSLVLPHGVSISGTEDIEKTYPEMEKNIAHAASPERQKRSACGLPENYGIKTSSDENGCISKAMHLAACLSIYLHGDDRDSACRSTEDRYVRVPGDKHKTRCPVTSWQIGNAITLGENDRKHIRNSLMSGYRGPLNIRFMVRGHWRNQAVGKAHMDRRMTWIKPFWKGPDMPNALTRIYDTTHIEQGTTNV